MTTNDILTLAKAGFTAEQIAALAAVATAPAAEPIPAPEPKPVEPTPAPQPAPVPEEKNNVDMDKILSAINGLTATVQANAIGNTQMPEKPRAEDILARVLDPRGGTK